MSLFPEKYLFEDLKAKAYDLDIPKTHAIVLKIDVEGSELAILRGARNVLTQAAHFVVLFEAHRDVQARSGNDPIECLRFLQSLRPCKWMLSADDSALSLEHPFFQQFPEPAKRDVIVWSRGIVSPGT